MNIQSVFNIQCNKALKVKRYNFGDGKVLSKFLNKFIKTCERFYGTNLITAYKENHKKWQSKNSEKRVCISITGFKSKR